MDKELAKIRARFGEDKQLSGKQPASILQPSRTPLPPAHCMEYKGAGLVQATGFCTHANSVVRIITCALGLNLFFLRL